MNKNDSRLRRAKSTRAHIRELAVARLSVHRTGQHIYAQVFAPNGTVVAAASTVQKSVAEGLKSKKNVEAAVTVAQLAPDGESASARNRSPVTKGMARRIAARFNSCTDGLPVTPLMTMSLTIPFEPSLVTLKMSLTCSACDR